MLQEVYHPPCQGGGKVLDCPQRTYARNPYLQNGVQIVILHTYPKVPKQKNISKKKEGVKVQLNPALQSCLRDTKPMPAPARAQCSWPEYVPT